MYLLCTTPYYKVVPRTTKYSSVLHSTTPVLLQYYSSTTPVLLCTTLYYKVLLQHYSVLQSATKYIPVLFCTTKYCSKAAFTMRDRSETIPTMKPSVRNPPRNRGTFRSPHEQKYNILRSGYHSKFHRILRLPRKVTIQLHQMLRLPRKVTVQLHQILRWIWHEKQSQPNSTLVSWVRQ